MSEKILLNRSNYKSFYSISTRWTDNDIYGHINNITYYSYFDTAVNQYLIENTGLNIQDSPIVGYVIHSSCNYLSGISYPGIIDVGIVVKKLGKTSVTYEIGIFKDGENKVSAYGEFVHVFVNRLEKKPVSIPKNVLESLNELLLK
jgi:acyl-CoA thioester hydrolase